MTRSKNKERYFSSLNFKSWLYFVLFAMCILLLLQIFQTVLLEPFYKETLHNDIIKLTDQIEEIFFSGEKKDEINSQLNDATIQNDACILIYNTKTTAATAYDALGESGCAIFSGGEVNPEFIDEMDTTDHDTIYQVGNFLELSTQQVMVYGKKYISADDGTTYYIMANYALQSMNAVVRTTQLQLGYITLIILALSIVISILFSRFLSAPITGMTKEAQKMSYGNYNVHFNTSGFNEIDELAATLTSAAGSMNKLDETSHEMIANVSHDIKTPLTMIRAYAEMIRDISGGNKKKRNEHLAIIIQETEHLDKLTSNMLELSKLKAQQLPLEVSSFDINGEIDKVISGFRSLTDKGGISIIKECEPELVAVGDKSKISEVFYNFISNALKHVGDDKQIIIRAYQKSNEFIRIEVEDHGCGICKEDLPYVWDRYYKSDRQYQRAQQGTGLGLAICKAIFEEHKCPFGVESTIGKGSTFYFEIASASIK